MEKKFLENLKTQKLLVSKERVVLGVSGGPDSVALLHLLLQIKKALPCEIILAHVNYNLRQENSKKDELLVRKFAKLHQLPLYVKRPVLKKNSEAGLREIRYNFFRRVLKKSRARKILTAHTLDDQIETFLFFLFRGSGLKGLTVMKSHEGDLVRPLLSFTKAEILAFLKKKKIPYRIDETNAKLFTPRNRLRHQVIPLLEKEFNPNLRRTLEDTIANLGADYALIEQLTAYFYRKLAKKRANLISFNQKDFANLPPSLRRHFLRKALNEFDAGFREISFRNLLSLEKTLLVLKNQAQKAWPPKLQICQDHAKIRLVFLTKKRK